ncbi:MAG TPA: nitrile hydratase subunit alpha, partial [Trebonia sp.]
MHPPRSDEPVFGEPWQGRAFALVMLSSRIASGGTAAIKELGFSGQGGEHIVVVENTATTHNVVVCTLCSCYPWPVLGLP